MERDLSECLLHPKIHKFYEGYNVAQKETFNSFNFLNENLTYNWSKVEELLFTFKKFQIEDNIDPKTYDDFYLLFQIFCPVFMESEAALSGAMNEGETNVWIDRLLLLGEQSRIQSALNEYSNPTSVTSNVENVLFLTSSLENALASVFQTIKRSAPHLLRDLLDTKELGDILGTCPILFLKVLMGSPQSVNLRNIAWHGFPLPEEMPRFYVATLFVLIASLALLIKSKNIDLKFRAQVTDFSKFILKIKPYIDVSLLDDISQVKKVIESSEWSGSSHRKVYWYRIVEHYQNKKHWQFVILILPQIELILRKIYAKSNNFDIRAKLDEYYITINTIFESKENQLPLCQGTLNFIYDLFISPYGIRIRDKISHGEVQLDCIDRDLCSLLLYAGLNLLSSNETFSLTSYKSIFHLNYLAYQAIVSSKRSILEVMTLKAPKTLGSDFNWDQQSIESLKTLKITRPIEVFDRSKKEPEISAVLMKVSQLISQVCENYRNSFDERFQMFLNRELRSRARKTFENMIKTLSTIVTTLSDIVKCISDINNFMQEQNTDSFEEKFIDIQRFLKQTLTIVENLVTYSDKESNEWLNAVRCCKKFEKSKLNFLYIK